MSRHDKLMHPVTGSLSAVFLMLLMAGLVSHADRYHNDSASVAQTRTNQFERPLFLAGRSIRTESSTIEDLEEIRGETDLGVQYRMAAAAEQTVAISFLALLGLFATVYYACRAWQAAEKSAKADNEALRLTKVQLSEARDTAARQSRCYIEPVGGKFIRPDKETSTLLTSFSTIEIKCVNHGKSIGKEIYCLYEVEFIDLEDRSPRKTLGWREFKPDFRSEHSNVAPDTEFSISLNMEAVRKVEDAPWDGRNLTIVRGAVYYKDVFDDLFRSGFVLLGLIPLESALDRREFPFGMRQSSDGRPIFELIERRST